MAAFYQKSYQKAMGLLQIALQNDAHNADALYYFGMCLQVAGKEDMAQEIVSKAALLHQQGGGSRAVS